MDKKYTFLIVNDDGFRSPGLARLVAVALQFGEVYVAAPESQCSAMSQRLTIFHPITVRESVFPVEGVTKAWEIGGTPVDCTKIGLMMMGEKKPDLVISGINHGFNCGYDIAYSGTCGAALEARMNHIPAMAFSEHHDAPHEVTDAYLPQILAELLEKPELAEGELWNVNFPGCLLGEYQGILRDVTVAPLQLYADHYHLEPMSDGTPAYIGKGGVIEPEQAPEGTDAWAVLHNYIGIGTIKSMVL